MSYDLDTLRYTERRLAALVVADSGFLPFFVKIQSEIEAREKSNDNLAKAKAIADSYKAVS